MSPLEQYMKACINAHFTRTIEGMPGKGELRVDRQTMPVGEMAKKHGVSAYVMRGILMLYGIDKGMSRKIKNKIISYRETA
jgi:hypothetical protein